MTTVRGFAGRLPRSPHDRPVTGSLRDGLRRFPRRTMGIYRPELDPSWLWRLREKYRR